MIVDSLDQCDSHTDWYDWVAVIADCNDFVINDWH